MTPSDFLKIFQSLKQEPDLYKKDLALTFLQKLMLLEVTLISMLLCLETWKQEFPE